MPISTCFIGITYTHVDLIPILPPVHHKKKTVAASPNACDGFFFNTALAASSDASCDSYYLLEIKIALWLS